MTGRRFLVVTGSAPYLGGPRTWAPLREAAPEFEFVEIDGMDFADTEDPPQAVRAAAAAALRDADGIIAHHTAAKAALDAVLDVGEPRQILLLSPALVVKPHPLLQLVRWLAARNLGKTLLRRVSQSKHERLCRDRELVRSQLALLMHGHCISEALVDEAQARIRDPRFLQALAKTAETLLAVTEAVDAAEERLAREATILYGASARASKTPRALPGSLVPGVKYAPMIEAPHAVAAALR